MGFVRIINGEDLKLPNIKIHADQNFNLLKIYYWIEELNDWFPIDLSAQTLKSAYAKKFAEKMIEECLLNEELQKNTQYLEAY